MSGTAKAWPRIDARTANRPRSDRRWQVVYQDGLTGRRRTRGGFATKGAAQTWANDYMTDRARGVPYVDPTTGDVTWQTAAEEWLKTKATLKVRTRAGYEGMISGKRSKLRARFGDAAVGRIRREDVQAYVAELAASGIAASTVRNHFYVLHQVLAEQVKRRRIPFNPCADVDLPHVLKPSSYEDLRTYLTPEDVEAIIAALPAPYDTVARLAVYTGMRAGEVAGLQLRDIDTDAGTIRVRRAVVDVNGVLSLDDTKTRKHRTIAIDGQLAIELDNYIAAHKRAAVEWFTAHPEQSHPGDALPLFVGVATGRAYGRADSERLDYSKLMRHGAWYGEHWKVAVEKAGLPDTVRFHDLRHAHASWLMALLPPKEVQERLGHASITTTMDRYAHVNRSEADDRARSALAGLRPTAPATGNVVQLKRKGTT
jgi:integrase